MIQFTNFGSSSCIWWRVVTPISSGSFSAEISAKSARKLFICIMYIFLSRPKYPRNIWIYFENRSTAWAIRVKLYLYCIDKSQKCDLHILLTWYRDMSRCTGHPEATTLDAPDNMQATDPSSSTELLSFKPEFTINRTLCCSPDQSGLTRHDRIWHVQVNGSDTQCCAGKYHCPASVNANNCQERICDMAVGMREGVCKYQADVTSKTPVWHLTSSVFVAAHTSVSLP